MRCRIAHAIEVISRGYEHGMQSLVQVLTIQDRT